MKLKVYQQGGGLIYTPFIPEQYADSSGRDSKSSSGSDSEDVKLDPLDKELLGLMKDQNLLPSDIQMIYNRLIAFQRSTQRLSGLEGTGSYRSVMPGMLQIMSLVSQAKYNKARADSAIKQMTDENTGSDVALDKYGRMYVQNMDGKIEKIKPSDYDIEKYRPISNSELMYLREQNLPFDSDILSDVAETVGMTSISKEIDRIIDAFGKTKTEGYFDKNSSEIFKALASKSPEGIYKLTEEKSSADLRKAWNIVFKQLPTNMQHVLSARAALSGSDPANFIHEIVLSNLDYTFGIDYDAQQSKAAGFDTDPNATKKAAAEQLTQNNYLQQIGNMRLHQTRTQIVPRAAKIFETGAMSVSAYNAGAPVDKDMDVLPKMSLADFRIKANAAKAGDTNAITFGNRMLDPTEYDKLMYDGSSEVNIVMLPYRRDPSTGKLMPDFKKLVAFNEVQAELRGNKNMSQTELLQLLSSKGLSLNDFQDDVLEFKDTMPFITVSAYASKDSNTITKDMLPYLEHLENQVGKDVADAFKNMLLYGTTEPSKNSRKIAGRNTPERWDLYRGNIYIPMENAARAMLLSGIGEYVPKTSMTDFAARVEAREQETLLNGLLQQNDPNYNVISQLGQFR